MAGTPAQPSPMILKLEEVRRARAARARGDAAASRARQKPAPMVADAQGGRGGGGALARRFPAHQLMRVAGLGGVGFAGLSWRGTEESAEQGTALRGAKRCAKEASRRATAGPLTRTFLGSCPARCAGGRDHAVTAVSKHGLHAAPCRRVVTAAGAGGGAVQPLRWRMPPPGKPGPRFAVLAAVTRSSGRPSDQAALLTCWERPGLSCHDLGVPPPICSACPAARCPGCSRPRPHLCPHAGTPTLSAYWVCANLRPASYWNTWRRGA